MDYADIESKITGYIYSGSTEIDGDEDKIIHLIRNIINNGGTGNTKYGDECILPVYGLLDDLFISKFQGKNYKIVRLVSRNILGVFRSIDGSVSWEYYRINHESLGFYFCLHDSFDDDDNDAPLCVGRYEMELEQIEKPRSPIKSARK